MAEKEGVSLNHYLVSTLSRAVGQKESQLIFRFEGTIKSS
jgi:hypothetical protein